MEKAEVRKPTIADLELVARLRSLLQECFRGKVTIRSVEVLSDNLPVRERND